MATMEYAKTNEFEADAQNYHTVGGGDSGAGGFDDFGVDYGDDLAENPFEDDDKYEGGPYADGEFKKGIPDNAQEVDSLDQFFLKDTEREMNNDDDLYESKDDIYENYKSDDALSRVSENRVYYEPNLPQLDSTFAIPVSMSDNDQEFDKAFSVPLIAGVLLAFLVGLFFTTGRRNSKSMDKKSYIGAPSSPVVKRDLGV